MIFVKRILGIEGGGTKTEWQLWEGESVVKEGRLGPGNMSLVDLETLATAWRSLPKGVDAVGIFLAGCGRTEDRSRLEACAKEIWPQAKIVAGSDRESGYAATLGNDSGILVIAGTGCSVMGCHQGRTEYASGWGHLLGDAGSGYAIAMKALRRLIHDYDMHRTVHPVAGEILRVLGRNSLRDLISWVMAAKKDQVASLAPVVLACAVTDDEMRSIIDQETGEVADYVVAVARRLALRNPRLGLMGGMFSHSLYLDSFRHHIHAMGLSEATYHLASRSGAWGAAMLAAKLVDASTATHPEIKEAVPEVKSATTEQRHERSMAMDQMTAAELVALFTSEEVVVEQALAACAPELTKAIECIVERLRKGGRLIYAGAGTSGRLGVLDASEIPPTFSAPPSLVQAIMAGGNHAVSGAMEQAEDSADAGAVAAESRAISAVDVACGIAASGRTPFVLGFLEEARRRGAATIFLTCNPQRPRAEAAWDVEIDLPTGPELLTGSTRLKAGTATKVALNTMSTCAMILLGKVRSNLMIDVAATNAKLRDRASRIVAELLGCDAQEARSLLEKNGWSVRKCLGKGAKH